MKRDPAYIWSITKQRLSSNRKRIIDAVIKSDDGHLNFSITNQDPAFVDTVTTALNDAYKRGWDEGNFDANIQLANQQKEESSVKLFDDPNEEKKTTKKTSKAKS